MASDISKFHIFTIFSFEIIQLCTKKCVSLFLCDVIL